MLTLGGFAAALLGCGSGPEIDPDVTTVASNYNTELGAYKTVKAQFTAKVKDSVSKLDEIILKHKTEISLQRINLDIAKSQQRDYLQNMKRYQREKTKKLDELERKKLNGDFRDRISATYDIMIRTYRSSFAKVSSTIKKLGKEIETKAASLKEAEKLREQLDPKTYGFPGMDYRPAEDYGSAPEKPAKPKTPSKRKTPPKKKK